MRPSRLGLLLLIACTPHAATTAPVPRQAAYNDYEYQPYRQAGTASISGQVFRTTRSGDVKYGAGSSVFLNPVTAYSTEWWHRDVFGGETLETADPRSDRTYRTVHADGEGRFHFDSLPAGRYFVASEVYWEHYAGYAGTQETGGKVGQRVMVDAGQKVTLVLNELKDW